MVIPEENAHCFFGGLDVAENLIEKRVFGGLVESHRDGSITETVEVGANLGGIDKIGVLELKEVVLPVDEEAQQYEFEEVVQSA